MSRKLSSPSPQPSPLGGEGDDGGLGEGADDRRLGGPSPQPSPLRGEGVGSSGGEGGVPRPTGERDAGRQGEGRALTKISNARRLRRNATDAEIRLWSRLRNRQLAGYKFVRQFPIAGFYADFACREAQLIVEVDGGQHSGSAYDDRRTGALNSEGYGVLRFWNTEVLRDTDGVVMTILGVLEEVAEPGSRYAGADIAKTKGEPA